MLDNENDFATQWQLLVVLVVVGASVGVRDADVVSQWRRVVGADGVAGFERLEHGVARFPQRVSACRSRLASDARAPRVERLSLLPLLASIFVFVV